MYIIKVFNYAYVKLCKFVSKNFFVPVFVYTSIKNTKGLVWILRLTGELVLILHHLEIRQQGITCLVGAVQIVLHMKR